MNCPICKESMNLGYIPSKSIEWIPTGDKPRIIYSGNKTKGFRITSHSFGDMKKQPAWYCSNCDKLIIDCDENLLK